MGLPVPIRVIATVYTMLLILVIWVVAFIVQRYQILGHIFRGANAFVIWLNPIWSVKLVSPKQPQPRRTIIMCNHLSNSDPFFVCTALFPWENKYIAKSSLFRVPFGGWSMSMAGDIPVYFTSEKGGWGTKKGSVSKMMKTCQTMLDAGLSIVVFPEGARSRTSKLQEFKDGFFTFACEHEYDIMPVALSGSENGWKPGDWKLDKARVYVTVGPIIRGGSIKDPSQLKSAVREEIIRLYYTLPNARHLYHIPETGMNNKRKEDQIQYKSTVQEPNN